MERERATSLMKQELSLIKEKMCQSAPVSVTSSIEEFFDFPSSSAPAPYENELALFLSDPENNLLSLQRFPLICQLFIKFNASTPSSAPVERLFSGAAQIITPRRNRLSDDHFEMMLLLKFNE